MEIIASIIGGLFGLLGIWLYYHLIHSSGKPNNPPPLEPFPEPIPKPEPVAIPKQTQSQSQSQSQSQGQSQSQSQSQGQSQSQSQSQGQFQSQSQSQGQSQPTITQVQPQQHSPLDLPTKVFEFDVVRVNQLGEMVSKTRRQASYWVEDLGNGVTLKMVLIPGGTFMMGAPQGEPGRSDDEGPQHQVTVPSFFMSQFPITQAQWQAIMGNNPSYFKGSDCPVESTSWDDFSKFCFRVSNKTGRCYRLPTEAEWEYACRAGTTSPFSCGETLTPELANYDGNYSYALGPKGVYREKTTPVGSFPPNNFGLYDMHGNVWEWCKDVWHENYQGAPNDGTAWITGGDNERRLLRGGSWYYAPSICRSANRDWGTPGSRDNDIGGRIVLGVLWTL